MFNGKLYHELSQLIAEMEQLKIKTQQEEQNSFQLTYHSDNKKIKKLVETMNSSCFM